MLRLHVPPLRRLLPQLGLLVAAIVAAGPLAARAREAELPVRLAPVYVQSPIRLAGAIVRGADDRWHIGRKTPLHYGEPVPVDVTAYCLSGTTRRGRYVRPGIVAADPGYFPLARYVELYVGTEYLGRFLVDDTGGGIRGPHLDVWMPSCRDARLFGRQRGTAVLVRRADPPNG